MTDKQYDLIMDLCMELGQEVDDDIERLSVSEASELIRELIELKKEVY